MKPKYDLDGYPQNLRWIWRWGSFLSTLELVFANEMSHYLMRSPAQSTTISAESNFLHLQWRRTEVLGVWQTLSISSLKDKFLFT